MKKTETGKQKNIFDTYKYSLKHRISAVYAVIYTVVCAIVMILFAAGSFFYKMQALNAETLSLASTISAVSDRTGLAGDEFRFYLNSLRLSDGVSEIYIYDSGGNFVTGTKLIPDEQINITEKKTGAFSGELSLQKRIYTAGGAFRSGEIVYTVAVIYDISATVSSVQLGVYTMCLCMIVGLVVFSVAGSVQTSRMLRPLSEISHVAKKISGENLNLRINVENTRFELNDLAETINDMMDRIQSSYDRQKRFVSDVSHELRTPISVISGYGSMLKRWGKDDEAILDESIEAIISESKNMQELVEKLLFLTRSDNNTAKYEFKKIAVSPLVTAAVREELMVHDGFEITADVQSDVSAELDEMSFRQIVRILVDNAVKYSGQSRRVDVSLKGQKDYFELSVADHGIGISPKDLPNIFDRFYRADESRAKETGGYGLGLSIAKAIVAGHGGHISVRTKPGAGTVFTVEIPYAHTENTAAAVV